jgi:hypothetical protein
MSFHPRSTSLPLLALLASLPCGRIASAQQALLRPGAFFFSVGGAHVATSELDDRLRANNYPTFGQGAGSAGIGGYLTLSNRIMLGAEITGVSFEKKPHNGDEVGLAGGHATFTLGYMKELSPRWRVYPRFGLGAGGLTLWVQNSDTATFDSILANPQPVVERTRLLTSDGGVVDLGVGAEFLPHRTGGWVLGARTGVLLAGSRGGHEWWTQNGIATNAPDASLTGFYLRLVVGGAWSR